MSQTPSSSSCKAIANEGTSPASNPSNALRASHPGDAPSDAPGASHPGDAPSDAPGASHPGDAPSDAPGASYPGDAPSDAPGASSDSAKANKAIQSPCSTQAAKGSVTKTKVEVIPEACGDQGEPAEDPSDDHDTSDADSEPDSTGDPAGVIRNLDDSVSPLVELAHKIVDEIPQSLDVRGDVKAMRDSAHLMTGFNDERLEQADAVCAHSDNDDDNDYANPDDSNDDYDTNNFIDDQAPIPVDDHGDLDRLIETEVKIASEVAQECIDTLAAGSDIFPQVQNDVQRFLQLATAFGTLVDATNDRDVDTSSLADAVSDLSGVIKDIDNDLTSVFESINRLQAHVEDLKGGMSAIVTSSIEDADSEVQHLVSEIEEADELAESIHEDVGDIYSRTAEIMEMIEKVVSEMNELRERWE